MSIKDDVKYVKTELSGDEKVLESAFKLETLYKKYKFVIWGAAAALVPFLTFSDSHAEYERSKA